jgi:hypothetical protein
MLEHSLYITKNLLHYYKPDVIICWMIRDKTHPFISPEIFDKLFVPRYEKCLELARNDNVPIFTTTAAGAKI